jgi:metal-responsive CopG/Arc/MetJ family transcriptional regulator
VTTTNATKRGRPPFADDQPRRVGVNLTIREDILEQVDKLAAEQGVARSALIGELLAKALPQ